MVRVASAVVAVAAAEVVVAGGKAVVVVAAAAPAWCVEGRSTPNGVQLGAGSGTEGWPEKSRASG